MKIFTLTSEERQALEAIMSRYQSCDDTEHARRHQDKTYTGWYGIYRQVLDPDDKSCFPGFVNGPLDWVFRPPAKPWNVRGEFVARLIRSASGSKVKVGPVKDDIWPNAETLNGKTLHLKHLSVSGAINLDGIKPKGSDAGLDIHFEKVFLIRLAVHKCIFGNVMFENCRAASILMPGCRFNALAFRTLPSQIMDITPLETPLGPEETDKLVTIWKNNARDISQGRKSAFAPDIYTPPERGNRGEGDFGAIILSGIKVENDIRFEGVRITGLAKEQYTHALKSIKSKRQRVHLSPTSLSSPSTPCALVLENAKIGGSVLFTNSVRLNVNVSKRHISSVLPIGSAVLNRFLNEYNCTDQLPFISMDGANLGHINVQNTLLIQQSWFLALGQVSQNHPIENDRALMLAHINSTTPNAKTVLDLGGAKISALVVFENNSEAQRAINDCALKDGRFKPDATDSATFHDAERALDTAMMARSVFCGNVNLDEAKINSADFSSVWVNGTVSMNRTRVRDQMRFRAQSWTSRIGGFVLGEGPVYAHDPNISNNTLIFAGCIIGPITDDTQILKMDSAYPPHPYWRISYQDPALNPIFGGGEQAQPAPCLIDGTAYTTTLGPWTNHIQNHPLLAGTKPTTKIFPMLYVH